VPARQAWHALAAVAPTEEDDVPLLHATQLEAPVAAP
jgi:hypothetical protein